ncbi:DUF6317 family protein [Actinoallomurus sp. CA-150999]|uniref:DUF6317 family protein n=1 Tax=Actinoallomurus sp. CA-150999 TaxID=3239887 RepID=UPI003D92C775
MTNRSDGYSVFIDDVIHTGGKFKQISLDYKNLMPMSGFDPVDTGNPQTNSVIETTLRTIGELHLMIAQAMYQHGAKLLLAGEKYEDAENASNANIILQTAVLEIAPNAKFPTPPNP